MRGEYVERGGRGRGGDREEGNGWIEKIGNVEGAKSIVLRTWVDRRFLGQSYRAFVVLVFTGVGVTRSCYRWGCCQRGSAPLGSPGRPAVGMGEMGTRSLSHLIT